VIQRARDEAHRFAISGHRRKRARSRQTSMLEAAQASALHAPALLRHFGGLQGVLRAEVEDSGAAGIGPALAQAIITSICIRELDVADHSRFPNVLTAIPIAFILCDVVLFYLPYHCRKGCGVVFAWSASPMLSTATWRASSGRCRASARSSTGRGQADCRVQALVLIVSKNPNWYVTPHGGGHHAAAKSRFGAP
jgi:hypothetical protein